MIPLVSLIPRPIPVKTDSLCGEVRIDGNIERNIVRFRFRFTDISETAPVCLTVSAAGKTYQYYCTIFADNPREMITPAFVPEFSVGQCFRLINVESLVSFSRKTPELA